jgi:hypothetical protein
LIPLPTLIHDAVELLKASSNVVVGEELALDAPEDLTDEATAQIGFYTHRGQDVRTFGN